MARLDRPGEGSWRPEIMNPIESPPRITPRSLRTCGASQATRDDSWQTYQDCKVYYPARTPPEGDSLTSLNIPMSFRVSVRLGSIRVLGVLNVRINVLFDRVVLESHYDPCSWHHEAPLVESLKLP